MLEKVVLVAAVQSFVKLKYHLYTFTWMISTTNSKESKASREWLLGKSSQSVAKGDMDARKVLVVSV